MRGRVVGTATIAWAFALLAAATGCTSGGGESPITDPTTSGPTTGVEPPVATARFDDRECWSDVVATAPVTVTCGTLTVPERHDTPDGPTVSLPLAVLRPPGETTDDPVVYLDGGPGGGGVTMAGFLSERPLALARPVVIIGQRGTRYAVPSLDCPEVEQADARLLGSALETPEADQVTSDAFGACYARVSSDGVDLSTYDSATAADDIEAARRALGYGQWSLYGISYGTRLALEVLRRHPAHVRAAVLDSTYPPDVDAYATLAPNAGRAFDELFAACAAETACASAYPDLTDRAAALYDRYEAEPVDVSSADPSTGAPVTVRWDGDRLMQAAFNALYVPELIPLLPWLVASAERQELALATNAYLDLTTSSRTSIAEGLYPAIECRERYPFTDDHEREVQQAAQPRWVVAAAASESADADCTRWKAPAADSSVNAPVSSPVPVLVLAGRFDPITPPAWGRHVAEMQSSGWYVELPNQGHAVSGDACADQIIAAWLAAPASSPDTGCVSQLPPLAWVTP